MLSISLTRPHLHFAGEKTESQQCEFTGPNTAKGAETGSQVSLVESPHPGTLLLYWALPSLSGFTTGIEF